MLFSEMQTRVTSLVSFGGYPDAAGYNAGSLINEAYAKWAWDTEYNVQTSTLTTIANQAEYVLPAPFWKEIFEANYGTSLALRLTDEVQEKRLNPLWLTAAAGSTARFFLSGVDTLRLCIAPSVGGDVVTFRGVQSVAPLVNPTDTPTFPDQWHIALCYKAAERWMEQFAQGAEADRMAKYSARYEQYVMECRQWLSSRNLPLVRSVPPLPVGRTRMS